MAGLSSEKSFLKRRGENKEASPAPNQKVKSVELPSDILALQHRAGNRAVNELVQFREDNPKQSVSDGVNSPGRPLETDIRTLMESKLGQDFGDVRIHTDALAAQSARSLGAEAYTVGRDIVFGKGRFDPGTREGRQLLAHELAHVIQQTRGGVPPPFNPEASHERSAAVAASDIVAGGPAVHVGGATGVGLACEAEKIESLPAVTPEELHRQAVQSMRGFASFPSGAPTVEPKGVGTAAGKGYQTFAAIQIIDAQGNQVHVGIGAYLGGGQKHGEHQAIEALEKLVKSVPGGRMMVVVEQAPCPDCASRLEAFGRKIGLKGLEVFVPTRESKVGKGAVRPKTAATTSLKAQQPPTTMKRLYAKPLEGSTAAAIPKPPAAKAAPSQPAQPSKEGKPQPAAEVPKVQAPQALPPKVGPPVAAEKKALPSGVSTERAKNLDFQTRGRPIYTSRSAEEYRKYGPPPPPPTIGRGRPSRFTPKGAGLAQVVPQAMSVLQDLSIRHAVAVQMLNKWSTVEKFRRDFPKDWIVGVVSLQEWEIAVEGNAARTVNYVDFFHGRTKEDALVEADKVLRSGVPKGWREVGPFLGWISPADSLEDLREKVDEQKTCFIATACYGSPFEEHVCTLREFRDLFLARFLFGRGFIAVYYRVSPSIAAFLLRHECSRIALRNHILNPIVVVIRRTSKGWRRHGKNERREDSQPGNR